MKFLKVLLGLLALLFALAHLGALVMMFTSGHGPHTAYGMGAVMGRVTGVLLGAAVALACFRGRS